MKLRKTALASIIAAGAGLSTSASSDVINMSLDGFFTFLTPDGSITLNSDSILLFGLRSTITATATFNTDTGTGTGTISPFSFRGNGNLTSPSISFQAIGDGASGPGPLILANMSSSWNFNNGIPVSMVIDASGFFDAVQGGLVVGQTITGVGAIPASNNASFNAQNIPIGPAPFATTTWDTTDIGPGTIGTNPSGTLPLIADTQVNTFVTTGSEIGIGGSPQRAGPFGGGEFNYDFTSIRIDNIIVPAVPVPAAAWLFGSGLLGLIGVARRRGV